MRAAIPSSERNAPLTWQKITLSSDLSDAGPDARLRADFDALFKLNRYPRDMAMAAGKHSVKSGTREFFFSPDAVKRAQPMLERYGAVDCPRPRRDELEHQTGHEGVLDRILS
jgi:hypothetical protein